ncbi:MAG: hypothetical protein ACI9SQ_000070, partial [Rubritalea sp.]
CNSDSGLIEKQNSESSKAGGRRIAGYATDD